jgi:uncharacterized protein YozE (UPF0346 family)
MERLDLLPVWRHVRTALDAVPIPLRVALAAEPSIDRRVALDRLAGFISYEAWRLSGVVEEEDETLSLFPELDDEREEDPMMPDTVTIEQSPSFGAWLLAQHSREDAIGELARQARRDPSFPRTGSPKDVSKRLNEIGADSDIHLVLDDAELDWLAL